MLIMEPIATLPNWEYNPEKVGPTALKLLTFDPTDIYQRIGPNIEVYSRYQDKIGMEQLFPNQVPGECACGCGKKLTGRQRRWASEECTYFPLLVYWIIKGSVDRIKNIFWGINEGACMNCGDCGKDLELDHIVAVCNGGGGCWLGNYWLICQVCHKRKTIQDVRQMNARKPAAVLPGQLAIFK